MIVQSAVTAMVTLMMVSHASGVPVNDGALAKRKTRFFSTTVCYNADMKVISCPWTLTDTIIVLVIVGVIVLFFAAIVAVYCWGKARKAIKDVRDNSSKAPKSSVRGCRWWKLRKYSKLPDPEYDIPMPKYDAAESRYEPTTPASDMTVAFPIHAEEKDVAPPYIPPQSPMKQSPWGLPVAYPAHTYPEDHDL